VVGHSKKNEGAFRKNAAMRFAVGKKGLVVAAVCQCQN
jgi:hypothetical protein